MFESKRERKNPSGHRRWLRNPAQIFLGPPERGDLSEPVVHKHDEFEIASERELASFEIEEDSEGHHYAVRKDRRSEPAPEPLVKYRDYSKRPPLHTEG